MLDSNSAAERKHDQEQSRSAEAIAAYLPKALEDVVDRVMRGERVPKSGRPAIDLEDFFDQDISLGEQTQWLKRLITSPEPQQTLYEFRNLIERRLRVHLEGSEIVRERAADMAKEAEEEA